jgi:glycosyltransferase involved in cell wall biosynthesis
MICGVGDYSYNLAKALSVDPEIKVGVLTSVFDGLKDKINGIEVFPVMKKWNLDEVLNVIKTIWHWSPDIVHIQYPTQGYCGGLLSWALPMISFLMGKRVVQTWHEGYANYSWRLAVKLLLLSIVPSGLVLLHPSFKNLLHPKLRWALWRKNPVIIPIASNIPVIYMDNLRKDEFKRKYLKNQKRLIVFFGFVFPSKGVELLFEIADPATDHIVIAGEISQGGVSNQNIAKLASDGSWIGKVTITGFLNSDEVSGLLSVADAVILPFRGGLGDWNRGSVYAAVSHGAFVITTSLTKNGYDEKNNVYYAKVDDVSEMKTALDCYSGRRRVENADIDRNVWMDIANQHVEIYKRKIAS